LVLQSGDETIRLDQLLEIHPVADPVASEDGQTDATNTTDTKLPSEVEILTGSPTPGAPVP
jgi:hypothetical protein